MDQWNIDCTKRGSSSKPTYLHQQTKLVMRRLCRSPYFTIILWLLSVILFAFMYDVYLLKLYLLDDTFDIRGPKELLPVEKLTIRVAEPLNIQDLNRFVLHYSICPVVHEIQVIWHSQNKEPPRIEAYKYTTTHSKVKYHKLLDFLYYESYISPLQTETQAIMLLDADVFVSCQDLKLAQSIWRSTYDSQVGVFPRLITSQDNHLEFQAPSSVAISGKYSVLLSAALLTSIHHLETMKDSAVLKDVIVGYPQCYDVAVSMWIMSETGKSPIWLDVDVDIAKDVDMVSFPSFKDGHYRVSKRQKVSNSDKTNCINAIRNVLKIGDLHHSTVKATRASTYWTW